MQSVASLGWKISYVVFTLELNTPQGNSVVFSSYCVIYICFLYPRILSFHRAHENLDMCMDSPHRGYKYTVLHKGRWGQISTSL